MTDTANRRALSASELTGAAWFKSRRSAGEQACIEVADVRATHGAVAVRDTKDPSGPAILLDPAAFATLVDDARYRFTI